jgi:hypothetical protein
MGKENDILYEAQHNTTTSIPCVKDIREHARGTRRRTDTEVTDNWRENCILVFGVLTTMDLIKFPKIPGNPNSTTANTRSDFD